MSNLRFVLFPATLLFIMALAIGQSVDAAYTYQKLNELMPELRQFLGRTHLGTLRPLSGQQRVGPFASFMDDDQFQASKRMARATFRERKSNNLRNLMRIGKRRVPPAAVGMMAPNAEDPSSPQLGPNAGMGGAVYYFSPNFPNDNQFQAYRPQSVWL